MSATKGLGWDLFGRFFNQGISFFISILLTRLLSPEEFGLVGMVLVFIFISRIFLDLGFAAGIIQKKSVSNEELSTIFFLNIGIGIVLTAVMFSCASFISAFYDRPEIKPLVQVLSFNFFLYSLVIVQKSLFTREVNFKVQTQIDIVAVLISGFLGIILAYSGFGVWALILQNLTAAIIQAIGYWYKSKWIPSIFFQLSKIKEIWNFSVNIFFADLLNNVVARIDYLIIGKFFSATNLGYYSRAQSLNQLVVTYSSQSIGKVFFPIISKMQDDPKKVSEFYEKILNLVTFISVGLSASLFLIAKDLFIIMFGMDWIISADMFQILVLYIYAGVISYIVIQFINASGKSRLTLRLEFIKKPFFLAAYAIGSFWGIEGFLWALVFSRSLAMIINLIAINSIGLMNFWSQIVNIIPYLAISCICALLCHLFLDINNHILSLLTRSFLFSILYLGLNYVFKTKAFSLLTTKIISLKHEYI